MFRLFYLPIFLSVTACGGGSSATSNAPTTVNPPLLTIDQDLLDLIKDPIKVNMSGEDDDDSDPAPEIDPGPTPFELYADAIIDFNRRADLIGLETLAVTPDLNIKPSGSADFAGFITINIDPLDRFSAEMALNLDFDDNTIEASNGQFFRLQQDPDVLTAYTGDFLYIRGAIGEVGINDLDLDVRGTLAYETSRLHVSANLSGTLLGDNAEGLIIRTPIGFGERFTVNLDGEKAENANVIISAMSQIAP